MAVIRIVCSCLLFAFAFGSPFTDEISESNSTTGSIWALLVAGSNQWYNYRHQADVCHAYQILHTHGIPDDHIVVMMYDDLATSDDNPTPGIIINHPNGADVYHGVPHDYTGETVTPENFLKILQGDEAGMKGIGSGKVIKSGPNDNVFVNFADHGAFGIIAFPDGELHASDLNNAIMKMHAKDQYNKMVFYIEACESGSMFENILPKNINVFATTASNSDESSYACYYDEKRDTYLGDVYSVMWMEDSDQENLRKETLQKQYSIVKNETTTSHVTEFGDMSISNLHVSEFQGQKPVKPQKPLPRVKFDAVPSPEVPLAILHRKFSKANSEYEQKAVQKEIEELLSKRSFLFETVKHIVNYAAFSQDQAKTILTTRHKLKGFDCYRPVAEYFSRKCFALSKNDYALRHMFVFVNMCEENIPVESIIEAMNKVCTFAPIVGIK